MNIKLITTEKVADKFNKEAINEYRKRLTRYCKLDFKVLKKEDVILKNISEHDYVIYINKNSKLISSEELANILSNFAISGRSNIILRCSEIKNTLLIERVNEEISVSKLQFDSGLMIVMMHERIYRAYRIINKEPYHK